MKKFWSLSMIAVILSLSSCSYFGYSTYKKPTKEEMVQQAADRCQTLGFETGTKEFRDCTVNQFNRIQDKM